MNHLFLLFTVVLLSTMTAFAQDSTQFVQYDVLYMKDGRVLKGEILSYDSQFGGISFKDPTGKVYNFGRDDYKYFVENQNFPVKKKNTVIRPRKDSGIGFNIGVSTSYIVNTTTIEEDDYFVKEEGWMNDMPISLYGTVGYYFSRQHFAGLSADFGMIADRKGYYAIGGRYVYQYDAHKTNTAFYVPIEAKYQHIEMSDHYTTKDTFWYDPNSFSYPGHTNVVTSYNNLALTIGHGFGFILKSGHSFNVELSFMKCMVLSKEITDLDAAPHAPNETPSFRAFRLGLFYAF
jgi:hypothetical protein